MPAIEVIIPKDLPPAEFRKRACQAAIKGRYGSVAKFAESLGVRHEAVYFVLNGLYTGGRVAKALSALTGIPAHVLFPPREKAA